MRKIVFFAIILSIKFIYSQQVNENYKFINPFTNTVKGNSIQYKPGHKVKIVKVNKEKVYFRYYKFESKKKRSSKKSDSLNLKYVYESDTEDKLSNHSGDDFIETHFMSTDEFLNYTEKIYSKFKGVRAGFYTIPFKLRINDFDFEQNINLGMNIGFQFRFSQMIDNRWIYEPTIGIGLSSINLNHKNSSVLENEDRTASALSLSSGLIIHFDSAINLGIFYGYDFLSNNDKEMNWKYNRKPWLGIGLNIGFSISESKDSDKKNKS